MPRKLPVVGSCAYCGYHISWSLIRGGVKSNPNKDHLTEATRDKIKALLKNETLVQAATWPDKIRKAIPQADPLHYVDVRRGSSYYDREIVLSEIASSKRSTGI